MAERLKATDCKSVLSRVRRFEPYPAHFFTNAIFISAIMAALSHFATLSHYFAGVAQLVER